MRCEPLQTTKDDPMARCSRTKNNGDQCGKYALTGATLCAQHGGKSPNVQKAIARRAQEEAARKALAAQPLWSQAAAPVTDPVEEMSLVAGQIRDARKRLMAQMAVLDNGCPCCGVGPDDHGRSRAHMELTKEFNRLLESMARIGIEDRKVKIQEAQVMLCVASLTYALNTVPGMNYIIEGNIREVFVEKLKELEAKGDVA